MLRPNLTQPLPKQRKRGPLRVLFSRTVIIILLLLLNFFLMFSLLFELFEGITILFGGITVATAVMLVIVLNSDDPPAMKLSWSVLIAILPLVGIVLYCYIQTDFGSRLFRKMLQRSIQEGNTHHIDSSDTVRALSGEDPDFCSLCRYLSDHAHAPIYADTQVQYFPSGEEKFSQLLQCLEKAEKFIFLEYFIVCPGYMWDTILDILVKKANEGVEVRVLYDGMNAVTNLPYNYPSTLNQLGIQCKMFSPVRPLVSTHYNNRDHRKILIIDGHTAFTGGINLQDRYINRERVYGHWKDTAVMLHGPAARSFTVMFLQMWNATERVHIYEPYLPAVTGSKAGGYVIPYGEAPSARERVAKNVYLSILNQANQYVYIMTPYLILDDEMSNAMQFAAKRGVDVRIVLPHIPDKRTAFALAKSHYRELICAGVKIYEYTPGFIHSKVFLSDDRCAVVGSINLDYRSLYLHYECAALLYRVDALADISADFQDTIKQSCLITEADVKKQSLFTRLLAAVLKIFAPLM